MYKALFVCILLSISGSSYSQKKQIETTPLKFNFKTQNKGKFYFYWGWNKAQYSYSDIQFKGNDYNFTLYDVAAEDQLHFVHQPIQRC